MLAECGPALNGKSVILREKDHGLHTSFVLCPFMLLVTLTIGLSFPGLYFPIWDDIIPDKSPCYRVMCKVLQHHFYQVLSDYPRKNTIKIKQNKQTNKKPLMTKQENPL